MKLEKWKRASVSKEEEYKNKKGLKDAFYKAFRIRQYPSCFYQKFKEFINSSKRILQNSKIKKVLKKALFMVLFRITIQDYCL